MLLSGAKPFGCYTLYMSKKWMLQLQTNSVCETRTVSNHKHLGMLKKKVVMDHLESHRRARQAKMFALTKQYITFRSHTLHNIR